MKNLLTFFAIFLCVSASAQYIPTNTDSVVSVVSAKIGNNWTPKGVYNIDLLKGKLAWLPKQVNDNTIRRYGINKTTNKLDSADEHSIPVGNNDLRDAGSTRVIGYNTQSLSHTGDNNAAILYTLTIPGNTISKNGSIKIEALDSATSSSTNKALIFRLNGTNIYTGFFSGVATLNAAKEITCINSFTKQVATEATANDLFLALSSASANYSFDFSSDVTVSILVQNFDSNADVQTIKKIRIIATY